MSDASGLGHLHREPMVTGRKIFCIGAHRTGTTSLKEALTILGFRVCPEQLFWEDRRLREDFYLGRYDRLLEAIREFDAFEDSPFNHSDFFMFLASVCPDAIFIQTHRDPDSWIASHRRWMAALESSAFLGDESLKAAAHETWRREYGQEGPFSPESPARDRYQSRNESIVRFFEEREGQLLVMDLEREHDPWRRLCAFVDRPLPQSLSFPHANRTK